MKFLGKKSSWVTLISLVMYYIAWTIIFNDFHVKFFSKETFEIIVIMGIIEAFYAWKYGINE